MPAFGTSTTGILTDGGPVLSFLCGRQLDLLYWSKGFTFNIPSWIGENYVFSPGDIVIATNNSTTNLLKKLSSEEFSVLSEVCIANGWWGKDGYQIPCRLGTPFPNNEELDTDGDGVFDNLDAFRLNSAESIDTDSDGIGNNAERMMMVMELKMLTPSS